VIRVFGSKANHKFLKQVYFRTVRALKSISSHNREPSYLEALSAEEVKSQLETMGLNQDWTFTDFDEAMVEQSSQHLWAKAIIKKKKGAFPAIFFKYMQYYKWKENLFELNKIFKYSDGLKELKDGVIPHLTLNENTMEMLNRIRKKKIEKAGTFKKIAYKFFTPAINLVIVSSNSGIIIKLFLDRDDIQRRFIANKIMIRAVVANKMGFDEKGNISGLSHRENIIDINTKKNYIPHNNIVLVDKRDSNLKHTHNRAIFVPSGLRENMGLKYKIKDDGLFQVDTNKEK